MRSSTDLSLSVPLLCGNCHTSFSSILKNLSALCGDEIKYGMNVSVSVLSDYSSNNLIVSLINGDYVKLHVSTVLVENKGLEHAPFYNTHHSVTCVQDD